MEGGLPPTWGSERERLGEGVLLLLPPNRHKGEGGGIEAGCEWGGAGVRERLAQRKAEGGGVFGSDEWWELERWRAWLGI